MLDFVTALRRKLQKEIDKEAESLAKGKAADYADYKERCGRIKAREDALRLITETVNLFLEDNGDDDD